MIASVPLIYLECFESPNEILQQKDLSLKILESW